MKKLMSMTDFNLKVKDYITESHNFERGCELMFNYSEFLKQPLTLGMFVLCWFRNGKYIPILPTDNVSSMDKFNEFQQAKERVLFDGFEYDKNGYVKNDSGFNRIVFDEESLENGTIEDLLKYNLTLTESAIKQLGL